MAANAEIILTKNAIIQKIKKFFEDLQQNQQMILQQYLPHIPSEVLSVPSKISRGENYQGLPWLVLDYPRYFKPGNIFAIRTLFWWGNFFSTTLHLSGVYKQEFEKNILSNYHILMKNRCYICVADKEWDHHLEENNYSLMNEENQSELTATILEKSFLKLAITAPLGEFNNAEDNLDKNYEVLLKACCQFPRR
jgi:hypothetical protein